MCTENRKKTGRPGNDHTNCCRRFYFKKPGNSTTTSQKLAKLDALISAILFANHVIELRLNFKNSKVTLLCNKKLSLDLMVVRIL